MNIIKNIYLSFIKSKIMLILFLIIPIILNLYIITRYKDDVPNMSFQSFLGIIFYIGIMGPIFEESFFRGILYDLTKGYSYYKITNAILFGLIHSTNYPFIGNGNKILIQVLSTFSLGYYLVNIDNVISSIVIHILYNSISIIYMFLLFKMNKKNNGSDRYTNIKGRRSYIWHHNLKRSKSYNDLNILSNRYNNTTHTVIKDDDLPEDVRIMCKKFEKIDNRLFNRFNDIPTKLKLD